MKKFLLAVLLSFNLVGCSMFNKQETEFNEKKLALERKIEILILEKRKAILEKQLDAIYNTDLKVAMSAEVKK